MADENEGDGLAVRWTVKLQDVQRLNADDPEDHKGSFAVDFEMQSPGRNGSITVLISDEVDEVRLIGQAREILQAALERWARVMSSQPGAERTEPTQD